MIGDTFSFGQSKEEEKFKTSGVVVWLWLYFVTLTCGNVMVDPKLKKIKTFRCIGGGVVEVRWWCDCGYFNNSNTTLMLY